MPLKKQAAPVVGKVMAASSEFASSSSRVMEKIVGNSPPPLTGGNSATSAPSGTISLSPAYSLFTATNRVSEWRGRSGKSSQSADFSSATLRPGGNSISVEDVPALSFRVAKKRILILFIAGFSVFVLRFVRTLPSAGFFGFAPDDLLQGEDAAATHPHALFFLAQFAFTALPFFFWHG